MQYAVYIQLFYSFSCLQTFNLRPFFRNNAIQERFCLLERLGKVL